MGNNKDKTKPIVDDYLPCSLKCVIVMILIGPSMPIDNLLDHLKPISTITATILSITTAVFAKMVTIFDSNSNYLVGNGSYFVS